MAYNIPENGPTRSYLDFVRQLDDRRYSWLLRFLTSETSFLEEHIHPVRLGSTSIAERSTHVVVADFPKDISLSLQIKEAPTSIQELSSWISTKPAHVHGRLIMVSSLSGVDQEIVDALLDDTSVDGSAAVPIVLTCPRKSGQAGTHPIKGHVSRLPNPDVLGCVANHTWIDPKLLLRFLDQNKHLTYRSCTEQSLDLGSFPTSVQHWWDLQISFDQENHVTVALDQETPESPWTMIILAAEDNCLGLDMNEMSSTYLQPLLASARTPSETFLEALHKLAATSGQRRIVTQSPLALVPVYSRALVAAFSSHIELYQRHWNQTYEPYANTSVVYGYAYHRDAVRQLARRYATHLRYIHHTLDSLNRFLMYTFSPADHSTMLGSLTQDFDHFARDVSAMKLLCDQFLEQQVSKLALQDARTQMQEARDLKRLSYLAFVFVPLSLTSSFFGMNVKELDSGPTPVWIFVVSALAILLGSIFIVWLSASPLLRTIGNGFVSFFVGVKNELFPPKKSTKTTQSIPTLPLVSQPLRPPQQPYGASSKPNQRRTWKFWKPARAQYGQYSQPFSVPPPNPYVAPLQEIAPPQSMPPRHWDSVPATYADPYEPLVQPSHPQYSQSRPMNLPEPPPQYLDQRMRPVPSSLLESDHP